MKRCVLIFLVSCLALSNPCKVAAQITSNSDPYGHLKPISNGIFGAVPVNAFNAEWVLWENLTNKTLSKEICERHRAIFKQEAEKLIGRVIPTEASPESGVTIIEPFTIVGYEINPQNYSILPTIIIRAKIDVDPSVGRRRLALISSGGNSVELQTSSMGTMWGDNDDKKVIERLTFIDTHVGIYSRINKITIVKGNTQDAEMKETMDVMLANDLRRMHQARKGKYSFDIMQEEKPTELEPECFKFITVAHELLASKYSQQPPVFEKYGIGRCKHTPTHRGAGSVGISKVMKPICFEDSHSFNVTVYKEEATGGNEAVLYNGRAGLKRHICNLDGELRSASYTYKGKARSTFYNNGTVDLYTNGWYSVEIDKDLNYIVFQKIKSTPQNNEQTTPTKKPEKKPYIKKTWPQHSKPGRIRKNPNNNAIEPGIINAGETFTIIDEQDGWSQVDMDDGTTGWIESEEIAQANEGNIDINTTIINVEPSSEEFNIIKFASEMIQLNDFSKIREEALAQSFEPTTDKKTYFSAKRTIGKKENIHTDRFSKKDPKVYVVSTFVSELEDNEIISTLQWLGYTETEVQNSTLVGSPVVTRTYQYSKGQHYVKFETTNSGTGKVIKELRFLNK